MNNLIPTPDSIPVNWWWFQILLLFTFLIHIILMNLMVGGSLLSIWDMIKRRNPDQSSMNLPVLVALTINFGVPPLLFVQVLYGHLFYSSSIIIAIPWILVIPVLILAYYGAHIYAHRIDHSPALARGSLLISTILLLYIGFMYVNNSTLALTPERWGMHFDRPGGGSLNLGEVTLLPRYLHFIIGAIAIAGLGKAVWHHFDKKMADAEKQGQIRSGLQIFGWVTLVQMGIGTWFWLSLPNEMWKLFMGQNIAYTLLMTGGWILALLILHSAFTKRLWASLIWGLMTLVVMIIIRDLVRHAYLGEIFSPADLVTTGESSPLLAFLVIFVIGLISIYYMLKLMFKPKTEQP